MPESTIVYTFTLNPEAVHHMRQTFTGLAAFIWISGLFALQTAAEPFEPLFQITDVTGECVVQRPDSDSSEPVKLGSSYPYGSMLRTGPDGSASITFSKDNSCTLNGNVVAAVKQDPNDKSRKVVHLYRGKIDLKLEENFAKHNGMEILTQCSFFNFLKGGSASFDAKEEAELKVVVAHCVKGEIEGDGPSFAISILSDNSAVTIACSPDQGFIRLRGLEGNFDVQVDDEDGQTRVINMQKNSVVSIHRRQSEVVPNILIVTILEADSEGNLLDASSFSTEVEDLSLLTAEPAEAPEAAPEAKIIEPFPPLPSTSSTSSSSTTTTTIMPTTDQVTPIAPPITTTTPSRPATTTTKPPVTPPGNT